MTATIRVVDHTPEFLGLSDERFAEQVERLKRRLARNNPVAVLTRRAIGGAVDELQSAPDRDTLLNHLLSLNLRAAARSVLRQITRDLPPVEGRITCHLVPNGGHRGSGNCFGPDRLLAAIPAKGNAIPWLRFVIAHEYSHTHRAFGRFQPETVRDHLIFEGLAMVLAEELEPEIGQVFRDEVTDEQIADFWAGVDLDAPGLEGYLKYLSRPGAYEAGARIVRSYLHRHGISVGEAHALSNGELCLGSSIEPKSGESAIIRV